MQSIRNSIVNCYSKNKKLFNILAWLFVISLCVFVHVFKLGRILYGIHVDEAGMGYDAYCLYKYGVDRYLNFYPVYLINFGGGQSALYAYLTAFFIRLNNGNVSTLILRLPALLGAFITAISAMEIVKRTFKKESYMLLCLTLFTIMPYFTMSSRFGLDCNLMLPFSTLFLYFLIKALDTNKSIDFCLAGIAGGITLYTYVLSYLVLPLFIVLLIVFLVILKKITFKQIVCLGIPMAVIAFPLILTQIINIFDLSSMKLGPFTITKLTVFRSNELGLENILSNIKATFNSCFLHDQFAYNTNPKYLTILVTSLPFCFYGIISSIYVLIRKFKNLNNKEIYSSIILLWFTAIFFVSLVLQGDGPNANKLNAVFFSLLFFTLVGLVKVFKHKFVCKNILLSLVVISYIYLPFGFYNQYFFEEKDRIHTLFNNIPYQGLEYIASSSELNKKPIYYKLGGCGDVYIALGTKMDPREYSDRLHAEPQTLHEVNFDTEELNYNAVYIFESSEHLTAFEGLDCRIEQVGGIYIVYFM